MDDPYLPPKIRTGLLQDGSTPSLEIPRDVNLGATLVLILAIYATAMVLPTGVVGAFVGPPIIYGFLVHLALACILFPCWRGLLHQRRWARWTVATVSATGLIALPVATAQYWSTGSPSLGEMLFPLLISSYAAAMLYTLFTRPSNVYFSRT